MDATQLQPFCSTYEGRPRLQKPFSRGEFTYATNGHILVRVPRLPEVAEDFDAPAVEVTFAAIDNAVALAPFPPALPEIKTVECGDCDEEGQAVHDCPDCQCVCETCGGTHRYEPDTSISIAGAYFNLKYIRQIAALPHARFQVETPKDSPNYFEFDGGIGCVMPMTRGYGNHLGELSLVTGQD